MNPIKVIAFDADDTLWENEPYFRASEAKFASLLSDWMPEHDTIRELFKIEMNNLATLGYGTKAFVISMIETAIDISSGQISGNAIQKIIKIGKEQLAKDVLLLDGIEEVLQSLKGRYRLVMATKGDLKEQEGKLLKSGLEKYFHHIEIVSEKTTLEYKKLIAHLDILPEEFLMIGNSLKSDIVPVLETGAWAIHIPFHTTWEHEKIKGEIKHPKFRQLSNASEVKEALKSLV